jgi:glycine cleavage system H protein
MQVQGCEFPDDVYFDVDNDVWLKPVSDTQMILGATTILSFVAGKITKINFKNDLAFVRSGQSIATIESSRYFGAIRSPIDARLIELNRKLADNPSMLNGSPYLDGWVAKVEYVKDTHSVFSSDGNSLLKGVEALSKLENRIKELRVHCFKKLPDDELLAVGLECAATLANLNELLKTRPVGTIVHVVSDDPLSDIEMIRWADRTKNELIETKIEDNLFHFIVEKKHS